tara:strand:+ start:723 stop:1334 length:612 start_codon:yes stop_codon:yes gene_type:complete
MPKVGNKKFSYTSAGQDAARKYARMTKQPIVYSYDEGGLYEEGGYTPYDFDRANKALEESKNRNRPNPTTISTASMLAGANNSLQKDNPYGYTGATANIIGGRRVEEEDKGYSLRNYMEKMKQMNYEKGGKAEGPKYPHDMYNPKTGEKFVAQNEEDHEEMKNKGYKHLDEMDDAEKSLAMQKKNEMAMGGKYEQFKRLMGLD